jgi:hypothetical protein
MQIKTLYSKYADCSYSMNYTRDSKKKMKTIKKSELDRRIWGKNRRNSNFFMYICVILAIICKRIQIDTTININ